MSVSMVKYLKFNTRACLTRLGCWEAIERWRLKRRYRRGFIHEPDFAFFRHFAGSRGLFVDIGANIGQSALSFRIVNATCPILSFEANPDMEFGLRQVKSLLGDGFDYRMHGLGMRTETKALYIPHVKGVAFPQCATFCREALEDNPERREMFLEWTGTDQFTIVERTIQLIRFDELNLDPELVKMDVEGGEMQVIAGMEQTLARCRPIVMTEGDACVPFLQQRRYAHFCYDAAIERLRQPWEAEQTLNTFFVPAEKVAALQQAGAIASSFSVRAA